MWAPAAPTWWTDPTAAGTYTVVAHYAGSANYAAADSVPTSFTITPQAITVTANPQTKVYGTADPALTYQITSGSLVSGDSFSGSLTRVPGENVGSYAIEQGTLTAGSNYDLTFVGANLLITPAPLTVTANNQTMVYGGAVPALTYTYTGLVNGDSSASFTGSLATAATSSSSAGSSYAITEGTLAATGNYKIGTFTSGMLTVEPDTTHQARQLGRPVAPGPERHLHGHGLQCQLFGYAPRLRAVHDRRQLLRFPGPPHRQHGQRDRFGVGRGPTHRHRRLPAGQRQLLRQQHQQRQPDPDGRAQPRPARARPHRQGCFDGYR